MGDAETLGSELRTAREGRDLTLEQAERQTRIRAHYLEALEQGNYSALPSAVQGRGFLRNYARFLGLDGEVLVARFDAVLRGGSRRSGRQPIVFADDPTLQSAARRTIKRDTAPARAVPEHPTPAAPSSAEVRRSRARNMMLGTLVIVGLSVAALVILILYVTQSSSGGNSSSPILSPLPTQSTATDVPEIAATPTNRPGPTPLPNPNDTVSPIPAGLGLLAIQITVTDRAYLRVTVDGAVMYAGAPAPGSVLQYRAKESIAIHAGDAAGIQVKVNGIDQPPLGQRHEIVDRIYNANALPTAPPTSVSQALPTGSGPPSTNTILVARSPAAQSTVFTASPLAALSSKAATLTPRPDSSTPAPSLTVTPSITRTPSATPTPSMTPTPSRTPIFLPHDTETPDSRPN